MIKSGFVAVWWRIEDDDVWGKDVVVNISYFSSRLQYESEGKEKKWTHNCKMF